VEVYGGWFALTDQQFVSGFSADQRNKNLLFQMHCLQ